MSEETEILIALAVSMEKERSLAIVDDVSNERIGGKTETSPTEFMAGYQMACEEISYRLKNEEWQCCGAVFDPAYNAKVTGAAPTNGERSDDL